MHGWTAGRFDEKDGVVPFRYDDAMTTPIPLLNRSILANRWTAIQDHLAYKTRLAGTRLNQVPASDTSRTCNAYGYCGKENRESQAVFHCHNCGNTANADTNAAKNILDRALKPNGMGNAEERRQHRSKPASAGTEHCQ